MSSRYDPEYMEPKKTPEEDTRSLKSRMIRGGVKFAGLLAVSLAVVKLWPGFAHPQVDEGVTLDFVRCGSESRLDTFERVSPGGFRMTGFIGDWACTDVFNLHSNKSAAAVEVGDEYVLCNDPGSDKAILSYSRYPVRQGYVVLSESAQQLANELQMADCNGTDSLVGNRVDPTPTK